MYIVHWIQMENPPCCCPQENTVQQKRETKIILLPRKPALEVELRNQMPKALKPPRAVCSETRGPQAIIWVFSASSFIVKLSVIDLWFTSVLDNDSLPQRLNPSRPPSPHALFLLLFREGKWMADVPRYLAFRRGEAAGQGVALFTLPAAAAPTLEGVGAWQNFPMACVTVEQSASGLGENSLRFLK